LSTPWENDAVIVYHKDIDPEILPIITFIESLDNAVFNYSDQYPL